MPNSYIGPSPLDIQPGNWQAYIADKPEIAAVFPQAPPSYEVFLAQARQLKNITIIENSMWTGRAGGSGLWTEHGTGISGETTEEITTAWERVPADFQRIFSQLPSDIDIPIAVRVHYFEAWEQNKTHLSAKEITQHIRALGERLVAMERWFDNSVADRQTLYRYSLGVLINASTADGKTEGLTDFNKINFYYDTLIWQYLIEKRSRDITSLNVERFLLNTRLAEHTQQNLDRFIEVSDVVGRNMGMFSHERQDRFDGIDEQITQTGETILSTQDEITELRERTVTLNDRISRDERQIIFYQYKILKNQIYILANSDDKSKAAVLRNQYELFLASLSVTPEKIVTEADDVSAAEIVAFKADIARAREASLRSIHDQKQRSTDLYELERLEIQEAFLTDKADAVGHAVSAYNNDAMLLDIMADFTEIEARYLDPDTGYFPVSSYYDPLDESRLPDEVVNQSRGLVPILTHGDGTQISDWVFVRREQDGTVVIEPNVITGDEFASGPDTWENFATRSGMRGIDDLSSLFLQPVRITPENYQNRLDNHANNQRMLTAIIQSHAGLKRLTTVSTEFFGEINALQILISQGPTAFTKQEDYLAVLKAQAERVSAFWDEHSEEIASGLAETEALLDNLRGLSVGSNMDEWETGIVRMREMLSQVRTLFYEDNAIQDLCSSIRELDATFTEDQLIQWCKTEGVVFACSIGGGVLIMTGVGAWLGAAVFAGIGGLALSAGVMATGGVIGQEVGMAVSGHVFDTGVRSRFGQALDGDLTNDELWQGYLCDWGKQAAMCFAFMSAGKIAGIGGRWAALQPSETLSTAGRGLLTLGGSVARTFERIIPANTAVGQFWHEYLSEIFEEGLENTAQSIHPALGAIMTTLNSMDGMNVELTHLDCGVTKAGSRLSGEDLVVTFRYSAGKGDQLLADLSEQYESAHWSTDEPGVIVVDVPVEGSTRRITYRFEQTQEPYAMRRAVTNRIRESSNGTISQDEYLADVTGIESVPAADPANNGREFRVRPDSDITFVERHLKDLGFVIFRRETDGSDPYILVETGDGVIRVYTQTSHITLPGEVTVGTTFEYNGQQFIIVEILPNIFGYQSHAVAIATDAMGNRSSAIVDFRTSSDEKPLWYIQNPQAERQALTGQVANNQAALQFLSDFGESNCRVVTSEEEGMAFLRQAQAARLPYEVALKFVRGENNWVVHVAPDAVLQRIGNGEVVRALYSPREMQDMYNAPTLTRKNPFSKKPYENKSITEQRQETLILDVARLFDQASHPLLSTGPEGNPYYNVVIFNENGAVEYRFATVTQAYYRPILYVSQITLSEGAVVNREDVTLLRSPSSHFTIREPSYIGQYSHDPIPQNSDLNGLITPPNPQTTPSDVLFDSRHMGDLVDEQRRVWDGDPAVTMLRGLADRGTNNISADDLAYLYVKTKDTKYATQVNKDGSVTIHLENPPQAHPTITGNTRDITGNLIHHERIVVRTSYGPGEAYDVFVVESGNERFILCVDEEGKVVRDDRIAEQLALRKTVRESGNSEWQSIVSLFGANGVVMLEGSPDEAMTQGKQFVQRVVASGFPYEVAVAMLNDSDGNVRPALVLGSAVSMRNQSVNGVLLVHSHPMDEEYIESSGLLSCFLSHGDIETAVGYVQWAKEPGTPPLMRDAVFNHGSTAISSFGGMTVIRVERNGQDFYEFYHANADGATPVDQDALRDLLTREITESGTGLQPSQWQLSFISADEFFERTGIRLTNRPDVTYNTSIPQTFDIEDISTVGAAILAGIYTPTSSFPTVSIVMLQGVLNVVAQPADGDAGP